ncbi:MAG TPA: hypothetical protein VFG68_11960 [Fimbriiglobus sp.]|nr:hypothetical protein [Fimbriiglobus sp.]
MALPNTSKQKSARIDWGYFNRRGQLARVRRWLWVAALAVVVAPLLLATVAAAWTGDPPAPLAAIASRGPLTSPHAAWDNRCDACHVPFEPINGDGWRARLFGEPVPTVRAAVRCEGCHAGPPHHPNERPESVAGCADCHRDHRGRDASLVRLADETCVRCHGDLDQHYRDPSTIRVHRAITGFADPGAHPEFRPVASPADHARTLKFSHATHMPGALTKKPLAEMIPDAAQRTRYAELLKAADGQAARWCAACHQLDAGRGDSSADLVRQLLGGLPREPLQPPRAAGEHFLPINYESHCQACHPLTFETPRGWVTAPHRVQPDELDRFLRETFAGMFLADELKKLPEPDRGPGRVDPRPTEPEPRTLRERVERALADSMRLAQQRLYVGAQTCEKCHHYAERRADNPQFPVRITPVSTPTVWMTRARFDHTPHRAVDCRHCHRRASSTGEDESIRSGGPLGLEYRHPPDLPGVAVCRECHSPAGGVRHGCTDCHVYHHADRGLQGRGSPARAPSASHPNAQSFLRGR